MGAGLKGTWRGGPNGREGRLAAAAWTAQVRRSLFTWNLRKLALGHAWADARQWFQRPQGICVTWDSGLRDSRRPKASTGHQVSSRQDRFLDNDSALVDKCRGEGGRELKTRGTILSGGNGSCSLQRWVALLYIPTSPSLMTVCSVPCGLAWPAGPQECQPPPPAGSQLSWLA